MRLAECVVRVQAEHQMVRDLCAGYALLSCGEKDLGAEASADRRPVGDGQQQCDAVKDYCEPDLVARVMAADLEAERARATRGSWSDAYLETLAVYRKIAEWAPLHSRILMHGAAIEFAGRAYLFCAASGTGKSTHIRLWRECLGPAVRIINGDKPLLKVADNGQATVFGTPWAGKEGWQRNVSAPLAGICFVERAAGPGQSRAHTLEPAEALDRMMCQVYRPADPLAAVQTLALVDRLMSATPLVLLAADMTEGAVRASFEALTGLVYAGGASNTYA